MIDMVTECLVTFVEQTRIGWLFEGVWPNLWLFLAILGGLLLMFGFRIYRGLFSLMLFMTCAVVSCYFMADTCEWGSIVTCFVIVGSLLAVLGYRWPNLGGFTVCAMIGVGIGFTIYPSFWVAILAGLLTGIGQMVFPVISLNLLTSVWGSWLLVEAIDLPGVLGIVVIVLAAAAGFAVQTLMNRHQKIFAKPYPDSIAYKMEQKKLNKKGQNA